MPFVTSVLGAARRAAERADKDKIKAIRCRALNCLGGMKGNQTCHVCDGTGSELAVKDKKGEWHHFPNTKEGYTEARRIK